jgi:hypothetical protein
MKKIIKTISRVSISLIVVTLWNINTYSQNFGTVKTSDTWLRAAMVSISEEEPTSNFKTTYGKACANILIKAHRQLLPYPDLPVTNISAVDKQKFEILLTRLQNLRNNPPTWEIIISNEEKKLLQEFSSPTPPVFVGNVKYNKKHAQKYKNLNRYYNSEGKMGKTIEKNISHPEPPVEPIKEKEDK